MWEALGCREAWGVVSAVSADETGESVSGASVSGGAAPPLVGATRIGTASGASVCGGTWTFGAAVV